MKQKAFISQPMRGLTDEEIRKQRKEAVDILEGMNYEVIDSYFEDYDPTNKNIPIKYLAKSIELLSEADLIFCIHGWSKARGCRIEVQVAKEYGLDILDEEELLIKNN